MSTKFPKPWFRKDRGLWYVQLHGRQHNLGRDREQAFKTYAALLAAPAPIASELVVGVIDGFLTWCQKHRKPRTYDWYKDHLQSFIDSLRDADELRTDQLKPFHVQSWVDSKEHWGASYKRGAITAVQAAFAWAERQGHIVKSPVRGVEKPRPDRREQSIGPEEFARIRDHYPEGDTFRDLLEFCWETGCRPQEARLAEARHVMLKQNCLAFPPEEAKGGKRWRIIILTEKAAAIVARLVAKHPEGALFRNEDGNPWTKNSVACRFDRLKKHFGVKYALYSVRHGFAGRMLTNGADSLTVATLMGHSDTRMLSAHYAKLEQQAEFLRNELRKASGSGGSTSASA